MEMEKIVAMAVAAVAEETKMDASAVKVISFREIHQSALEQYIADHQIQYKKYQLGE